MEVFLIFFLCQSESTTSVANIPFLRTAGEFSRPVAFSTNNHAVFSRIEAIIPPWLFVSLLSEKKLAPIRDGRQNLAFFLEGDTMYSSVTLHDTPPLYDLTLP